MLTNPMPAPILRLLEVTSRFAGLAVIFAWGYLALALCGVVLAWANISLPAARGLLAVWESRGVELVVVTVMLTLAQWLAARMVQAERARPTT